MIIKIVTLSLMAVFYICYFAKLISQKKQGINTDQLGKGKEGFVKFIEVALKIITYLLPVIQIFFIQKTDLISKNIERVSYIKTSHNLIFKKLTNRS